MRCEHMVWKENLLSGKKRLQECRHWLSRVDSRRVLGGHSWHLFRCRFGHETRILVRP